jgi:chloramphenicol-sensitive protein RarD
VFDKSAIQGAYFALAAYLFWGVMPIYFKAIAHVSAVEILLQRVLWSVVLLVGILIYKKQLYQLRISRDKLGLLFLSALLLSINWLVFIYAVLNDNIVEASLGYFINPLLSVFLGMIFLGERLRQLQWLAIAIVFCGISFQLLYFGAIPWIALILAASFGFYGLIRKQLQLQSIAGLALETLMMAPFALAALFWVYQSGELKFGQVDISTDLLLIAAGLITSFPLLCFAAAINRLSLTAAGMFQYIAPSVALLIAVVMYQEPFGVDRLITFSCIWLALVIFTFETLHHHRKLTAQGKTLS